MNVTKKQWLFIIIYVIISLVWMFIPEVNSQSEATCYEQFLGTWMSYKLFNKLQTYYFLAGTFIFAGSFRHWNYTGVIVLALLLLIPVLIKLYIYACAH